MPAAGSPQTLADAGGRHAYPADGLWGEGLRAGLGLALGLGLMLVASPGGAVFVTGAALTLLFLAFGLAVWIRRRTVIDVDPDGLTATTGLPDGLPFGLGARRIDWADLRGLTLRYYSTRRDRSGGWMQLTLKAGGTRLTVLSTISGFPQLVRQAEAAARHRGVRLGTATERNLQAVGGRTLRA